MSYILDALRKADAERVRGSIPDLHAQPVLQGSNAAAPATSGHVWIWVAAGASVVALVAVAWALLARDAPRDASAVAPAVVPAAAPVVTPAVAQALAPVAQAATASAAPPLPTVAVAAPVPAARAPVARKPAATAPVAPPEPPARKASEPRVYTLAELPDDIRRELPALAIGGAMYSENPANRMLIINGQVFHERDKLSPNLTLVQIKLKAAVLEYRGYRYGISY
jgi:general secretion pathway protein B